MSISAPVIFLIYRRPDLTARVFAKIREAQPKQLFVVADGAKNADEQTKCEQARAVIEQVDWDCEVHKNYADHNMGCRDRIASGVGWAFSQVESAIILEDDCLPNSSFFPFCEELLEKYKDDERIMTISGNNFQNGISRTNYTYYFSKYNHCWGWATWRRAWQYWDDDPQKWTEFRELGLFRSLHQNPKELNYWTQIMDEIFYYKHPNTWDYQWTFACWAQNGLTVLPNVNLVANIGFSKGATHITNLGKLANLPTHEIEHIKHPQFVQVSYDADRYTFQKIFSAKMKIIDRLYQKFIKIKDIFSSLNSAQKAKKQS